MDSNKTLQHSITRIKGKYIKEYWRPYWGYTTLIKLDNGRLYFAPTCEFIEL